MPPNICRINNGICLRKAWLGAEIGDRRGYGLHTLLSIPRWLIGLEICTCIGGTGGTTLVFTADICYQGALTDVCLSQASHNPTGGSGCMHSYLNTGCLPFLLCCSMVASSILWGIYCVHFLAEQASIPLCCWTFALWSWIRACSLVMPAQILFFF